MLPILECSGTQPCGVGHQAHHDLATCGLIHPGSCH